MAKLPVNHYEVINIFKKSCKQQPWVAFNFGKCVKGALAQFMKHLMHIMNLSITHIIFPTELKLYKNLSWPPRWSRMPGHDRPPAASTWTQ